MYTCCLQLTKHTYKPNKCSKGDDKVIIIISLTNGNLISELKIKASKMFTLKKSTEIQTKSIPKS